MGLPPWLPPWLPPTVLENNVAPEYGLYTHSPPFISIFSGEEKFTCVWLKPRGNNVLEFQMGKSAERARAAAKRERVNDGPDG